MSDKISIVARTDLKNTTFMVRYYDEFGERKKKSFKNKIEAENFRQRLIAKRNRLQALQELKDQGIVVSKAEELMHEPTCINEALKGFYESKRATVLDPKDLKSLNQEKLTYNFFGDFIMNERERETVEEITLLDLEKFREMMQGKGLKNATVKRKETSVRAFLNYCVAHKYVTENVAKGLKKLPVVTPKRILYSETEKDRLLRKLDRWAAEFFMMLEETMARPVELERVRMRDIDWQTNDIRVISSKGGVVIERNIPLTDNAVLLLRRIVLKRHLAQKGSPDDYVFVNSIGNPVETSAFNRAVRRARVAAGLPQGATPYALRHAGLNDLKRLRVPMASIGAIAGHRKASTTMQYMQESKEEMRNVIDLVNEAKKKKPQLVG